MLTIVPRSHLGVFDGKSEQDPTLGNTVLLSIESADLHSLPPFSGLVVPSVPVKITNSSAKNHNSQGQLKRKPKTRRATTTGDLSWSLTKSANQVIMLT